MTSPRNGSELAWMLAVLLACQAALGVLRRRAAAGLWSEQVKERLGGVLVVCHASLGYLLLPLTFLHAMRSMKGISMREANVAGLWIATGVLLLLAAQAMVGALLVQAVGQRSQLLRRVHWGMAVVVLCAVAAHLVLNG